MSEVISPAEDRQPVVIVVVGRQRVGKTSFLNTTVQFLRAHGGEFVVWNADKLNRTYSLSMFSGDVLEPTRGDAEDVKAWLEDRFTHLVQHRYDAVLDIGGGDTPLAFLAQPRRLGERRLHFGLNAEVALKRLSRLLVSGEVEQPGCGVVVRAGCSWEAWPLPLRQAKLLAVLDHPMHLLDAAGRAGVTSGAANAMGALVAAGQVRCESGGMYVRTVTMASVTRFIEWRLKLHVNAAKSAVARPWERSFLGFTIAGEHKVQRQITDKSIARFKFRVKALTRRSRGVSFQKVVADLNPLLRKWDGYFGFGQAYQLRPLDAWVRRRLRWLAWVQWKTGRRRFAGLCHLGATRKAAFEIIQSPKGPWKLSLTGTMHRAFDKAYFRSLGLVSMAALTKA